MNSQILALKVAAIIFLLVSVVHVVRLIFRIKVTIGNFVVPLGFNTVGILISASRALWMVSVIK